MGNGTSLCATRGCASWYLSCEVGVSPWWGWGCPRAFVVGITGSVLVLCVVGL